jgi:hypothetical protein
MINNFMVPEGLKGLTQDRIKEIVVGETAKIMAEKGVAEVERILMAEGQRETPVIHRFGPGLYIREVMLPAGCLVVGNEQLFEQQNMMLTGKVTMISPEGTTELTAPASFVGPPGRKVGLVHEDTYWLNIFPTDEQDIETLEYKYIYMTQEAEAAIYKDRMSRDTELDREDYEAVLKEFNFVQSDVDAQVKYAWDITKLPYGAYKFMVSESPVHGRGVFATCGISQGEIIGPARIDGRRTVCGRMTNHGINPNAIFMEKDNGDLDMVAIRPIGGNLGGFHGEEIQIDYRQALGLAQPYLRIQGNKKVKK